MLSVMLDYSFPIQNIHKNYCIHKNYAALFENLYEAKKKRHFMCEFCKMFQYV